MSKNGIKNWVNSEKENLKIAVIGKRHIDFVEIGKRHVAVFDTSTQNPGLEKLLKESKWIFNKRKNP